MRLCSICDRKIEGSWCKNCHRFVKTYELPGRIYLNQSHDPFNDTGCTYHETTKTKNTTTYRNAQNNGTTTTRQSYSQSAEGARTSSSGTKNTATGKKKKKWIAIVIIILYIGGNLFGAFMPGISSCVDALSEEFKESFLEENKKDDTFAGLTDQDDSGYVEKLAAIEALTPLEEYVDDDYICRYYDPRDIVMLGFACDETHFDMKIQEFDEWLEENWEASFEIMEENSRYSNYFCEDEEETWLHFSMHRDYYGDDGIVVGAEYDTVTQQLHMFGLAAEKGQDLVGLGYEAMKKFDPETNWTQKFFKENLKNAWEEEGFVTVYSSDELYVDAHVSDGYYFVTFYSTYEY